MKKANNFQIKVQLQWQGVAFDFFCQFQPTVAYKSAAYKKVYWFSWFSINGEPFIKGGIDKKLLSHLV